LVQNAKRTDEGGQHTEYGVDPNYVCEKSGSKENQNGQCHEKYGRTVLYRACAASNPGEYFAHEKEHEESPCDADQQDPDRSQPALSVYECDAEGEQRPSDDVVPNASRQDDYPYGRVEQLELRQNAAQHGKSRDRVRDAGEEHEMRVRHLGGVDEAMIEGDCERSSESEWNGDASSGDGKRETRIATDDGHIDLKPDEKKEETESDIGNKREV
jgi:hypothetical protein